MVERWTSIARRSPRTRVIICRTALGYSGAGEAKRFVSLVEVLRLGALPRSTVSEDLSVFGDWRTERYPSH